MNILTEINKIENEIERSTREVHQAEGKKEAKIETLKSEFGITLKQVDKEVKKIEGKQKEITTKIESEFKSLQEEYSWE